jgi:hypothetical protein
MNISEFLNKVRARAYESQFPYPPYRPDQKVRVALAESDRQMRRDYQADERGLRAIFRQDFKVFAEGIIGKPLTQAQDDVLYGYCYEEGHANGYEEIVNIAHNICGLIKEFI